MSWLNRLSQNRAVDYGVPHDGIRYTEGRFILNDGDGCLTGLSVFEGSMFRLRQRSTNGPQCIVYEFPQDR